MDNVGDNLAFRLHTLEFGDILGVEKYSFQARFAGAIAPDNLKPAPGAIARAQAAAVAGTGTRLSGNFLQAFSQMLNVNGMNDGINAAAEQFLGVVTQGTAEGIVNEMNGAIRTKDGDEFLGCIEQRSEVLRTEPDRASLPVPAGVSEASVGVRATSEAVQENRASNYKSSHIMRGRKRSRRNRLRKHDCPNGQVSRAGASGWAEGMLPCHTSGARKQGEQALEFDPRRLQRHARNLERYVCDDTPDPGENPATGDRVHIPGSDATAIRKTRTRAVEPV